MRRSLQHPRLSTVAVAVALLSGMTALGGCTLLGARDFDRHANAPPVVKPLPLVPVPPVPALVAIRFPTDEATWSGPLGVAVGLARSRKPDVLFTVETAVGPFADPTATAAALGRAAADGQAVGDRIVADGADRLQVQLTAVADPSLPAGHEVVRVFVR